MARAALRRVSIVIGALSLATLGLGCGGGDDAAGPDAAASAADAGSADAMGSNCTDLEAAYGDLGAITGSAIVQPVDDLAPDGDKYLSLQIPLNQDTEPDVLFIELWGDSVPFDMGFAAGTYSLIADQADLITCGACVYISADHVDGQDIDFHMAVGGSLQLDVIDETPTTGRVMGSLSNVVLRQVTVSQTGQTSVPNGCRPTLDAVSFDFTVAVP